MISRETTPSRSEKTFGRTVRTLRQEKSIGLRELARRVGISPTCLTQIMNQQPVQETKS